MRRQRKQDFYVNYAANDHYVSASMQDERRHRMTDVYARLAPGATAGAAQAELRQIAARLHDSYPEAYPKSQGFDTVVTPWKDELTAKARPTLLILLVTTVFVLVIACANVANLTLTRLVQREREMAIRAALGARGALLRRQLLAENLVLSVVGGALGLGLAVAGLDLLTKYTSRFTNRTGEIALDGWVLSFTLVVSIGVGAPVRVGAAPRVPEQSGPGDGQRRRPRHRQRRPPPRAAGAGRQPARRVVHAADRRRAADAQSACSSTRSIRGSTSPTCSACEAPDFSGLNRERRLQFSRDVLERVRAESTVQGAAMASAAPLAGSFPQQQEFRVDGADAQAVASAPKTVTRIVSSGYFETVGTRLKAGRAFRAERHRDRRPQW